MSGRVKMKYGVQYDPEFWGEKHSEAFAEFSWEEDAERFATLLRDAEHIDVKVVEL